MKKILSLIIAALIIPFTFTQLKANENDEYTVYYEQKTLIDKMVIISGGETKDESTYPSTGYITLAMGNSTTFNIDLSNFQNMFSYFDADNITSVVIDFDLGSIYTGVAQENQQWVSTYPGWDIATQSITFDLEDLPSSMSVEAWWNVIGESGGAPSVKPGALRFYSANIIVNYAEPVLLYEQITNFADLPDTDGAYTLVEFTPNNNGTFRALFHGIDGVMYLVPSMELPEEAGSPERAIYYTEDGNHLLWFIISDNFVIGGESIMSKPWLVWSLDTGQFTITKNYTIHGKAYGEGNLFSRYNMLYVDVIFPFDIDELLTITFNYTYRYHYLFGDPGAWQTVNNQTYINGEYSAVKPPWWNPFARLYFNKSKLLDYNQIEEFTDEIDADYKSDFVAYMQKNGTGTYTVNSIFMEGYQGYRIFLGQFDKFGSNGIEVKDIILVNFRAEIPGYKLPVIIFPGIDQVDIIDSGEPNVPNITPDFDVLTAFFSQAAKWLLQNPAVLVLFMLIASKWIFPLFMDAYDGIDKVGKIVRKLFTAKGALIALIIFVAYYYFMR